MPFYEYKCDKCGNLEIFQDITDEKLKKCPDCNNPIKRLISLSITSETLYRNARENLEKNIKPDAKKIADKIKNGDEDAAANLFGEDKIN